MKGRCGIVLALLLLACGGEDTGQFSTAYQALDPDPGVAIVSPANNIYIAMDMPVTPVTVHVDMVNWAPYPGPGKEVRFLLDGQEIGAISSGLEFTFPDVPMGVHTLTAQLVEEGGPLALESAVSSRFVRITIPCAQESDCEEGNPCSYEGCISVGEGEWECHWGWDNECCFSIYDCPWGTNHCFDVD